MLLEVLAENLMQMAKKEGRSMMIAMSVSKGEDEGLAVMKAVPETPRSVADAITVELINKAVDSLKQSAKNPDELAKGFIKRSLEEMLGELGADIECDCPRCSAKH